MYKLILTTLFALSVSICMAQQEAQFTQFMHNKLVMNPAYAGAHNVTSITGLYRNQWLGFEGNPVSQTLSVHGPIFGDRVGLGLTLFHTGIGITDQWNVNLAYSYKVKLSDEADMRIGLHGSFRFFQFGFASSDNRFIEANDDAIPTEDDNTYEGNFGIGVYFNTQNFYLGISSPYILTNDISFQPENATFKKAEEARHFYGMAGATFPMSDKVELRPSVLFKYVENAPFDMDFNVNLMFNQKFSVGASYRLGGLGPGESVDLLLYYQATRNLGIGAAYDFTLGELNNYNSGSIEVLVRYDFFKGDYSLDNPRFFYY